MGSLLFYPQLSTLNIQNLPTCTNHRLPSLLMGGNPSMAISISLVLLLVTPSANSVQPAIKVSLVGFLRNLANNNARVLNAINWNASSDPCTDGWTGVICNERKRSIRIVALDGRGLTGWINASLLCKARSLAVLSLRSNDILGELPAEISNCTNLTHLYINDNRLTGRLPSSLSDFNNLKRLDISNNYIFGELPELQKISGLVTFFAQNNHLNGSIPPFDFTNLQQFNVSYNDFTGKVPRGGGRFSSSSFLGNSGLCGEPLSVACPPPPAPPKKSKSSSTRKVIMFSGYIILGVALLLFFAYIMFSKKKSKQKGDVTAPGSGEKPTSSSSGHRTGASRSEYSLPSSESAPMSSSLFVLRNPASKELRFEDLLKAPAEPLGRGRYGSTFKVMLEDGTLLAVKRIMDRTTSAEDFHQRMERMDKVKHRNVLSAVAFYRSKQEKLVVYEYQQNGSLFQLLHGSRDNQSFGWASRLDAAASVGEGLAFMHTELYESGIAHGNLKSTNILMNANMHPCISEYGLMSTANQRLTPLNSSSSSSNDNNNNSIKGMDREAALNTDVYRFGVILLELLTGKEVQNNGFDLATWVHSVVREEWTTEVFDKALIAGGASEERMVHLLQVALQCIDSSPNPRPSMNQVAAMIHTIKGEEERSITFEV